MKHDRLLVYLQAMFGKRFARYTADDIDAALSAADGTYAAGSGFDIIVKTHALIEATRQEENDACARICAVEQMTVLPNIDVSSMEQYSRREWYDAACENIEKQIRARLKNRG